MKIKFLCVVLLFAAYVLFANPFLGKWKMELVGATNAYILEFVDDTTYSIVEVNVNTPQYLDYSIDEKNQEISLGKINDIDMVVRYSFNKQLDTFSLFLREDFIENQLLAGLNLGSEQESDTQATLFTKDFVSKFKKGIVDLLRGLPVAVGKKIKQSSLGPIALPGLKVAILAPLSGPVPTFGISTREGALLAINEWNAKGGVLGRKITPIVEDSQCTPDPAVNAADKVIDKDKIHYIIGEVCSKASIPVSEIANSNKVIQISPTSTNPAVTVDRNGNVKPYIFRACFTDPFQGKVGASFAYNKLGAKTAFIMGDRANDYVMGLAQAFEATFTGFGGRIVGRGYYDGTETDFSGILNQIEDSSPDVIYLPDYYNIVNLVTKQAKAKGITAPFMGGDGWDSSDLDVEAADGSYYTNHYSPDDTRPEVQRFLRAYGAAYKDDKGNPKVPDALAALAYDATNLLLTGIKNAGADNTDKVKAALEGISFKAVTGTTTFDSNHNPVKGAVILHVLNGMVVFDSFLELSDANSPLLRTSVNRTAESIPNKAVWADHE